MKKTLTKSKHRWGDIVFIDNRSPSNILARAIRFVENGGKLSPDKFMPHHLGIIIEVHDDLKECKIIQSGLGGVKISAIKGWSDNPKTNIIVKRCNRAKFEKRKKILKKWLLKQVGKKYDYPACAGILIRFMVLKATKNRIARYFISRLKNPLASRIKFTCSEFVAKAFIEAVKIRIFKNIDPANITPYDIYKSKKLRIVTKITNFDYIKK